VENIPIDPVTYMNVMKKTRRRRLFLFVTLLAYIPALLITRQISPTDSAMGTLFVIWVIVLTIVAFLAALSRCPRCANYFPVHGLTFLVLRRCLHCQLHISSATGIN
jgi:TRAP-type uncharacterized transport system fused permease subunit